MTTSPTYVFDLNLLSRKYKTGIEHYALQLSRELSRRNDIQLKYFGSEPESTIGKNARQIPLDLPISDPLASHKLLALTLYAEEASLLFSPYYPTPKNLPCKSVFTIHDLIPLRHPEWFNNEQTYQFFQKNVREGVTHADHILADSHSTKKDIIELFGAPEEKITVAHLAADPKYYSSQKTGKPILINGKTIFTPYLLSVCTLEPRKNLINTLEAYTSLRNKIQSSKNLRLVLVGALGWGYETLLEKIEQNPYRDDIIITGYITEDELAQLYANAEAFIYASLYEGFGLPVLEAMASGVPVITSANSSLTEVGGKAVIYKDPHSIQSIAEGMEAALYDETVRTHCINEGEKQAKQFRWEKTANTTLAVFDKVLHN